MEMKKILNIFKNIKKECRLLLLISYLISGFLVLLNLYIGYLVFKQFKGDGWSFMGGFFILTSYIVTLPAIIFSVLSIRMVKSNNNKKHLFPIVFGILGIIIGFILYNAISWWIFIVLFNVLLIIASLSCKSEEEKKGSKSRVFLNENSAYKINLIFQLVGLTLLFILVVFFIFNSNGTLKQQIMGKCIFIFLFLLHSIVTFAFSKKKKWALNFNYIESFILLGIIILIFLSAVITEGVSFTNTFLAIFLLFTLLIFMFSLLIHNYNKLKKSGIFILLFIFVFVAPVISSAQKSGKMQKIYLLEKNDFNQLYVEFYSTDIKDFFNLYKLNKYPSINLFNGYLKTCWVADSVTKNKKNSLYIRLPDKIPLDRLILNIFSGYGKNKRLYYLNARPKKLEISIFAAYHFVNYDTEVAKCYLIKKYPVKIKIVLDDTFGVQSFPLNLNKESLIDFHNKNLRYYKTYLKNDNNNINLAFILKLVITDVYKGNKYDDICISEIFFNNRFVTSYPDKFNQINNVYIEGENILMADYANKKGVIIYKDKSSVFTMVDWKNHSNWVILHYVRNNEVGQNSRIEESYLLIDLKNRKVVNNEFEKSTGISIYSPVIEKDKKGKLFLDTFDKYKVELK